MTYQLEQEGTRLITAKHVRDKVGGISDVTFWRWRHKPTLDFHKPIKINKRLFFQASDIESWIQAQRELA